MAALREDELALILVPAITLQKLQGPHTIGTPSQHALMAALSDEAMAPILVPATTARSSSASWPWDLLLNMLMAVLSDEGLAPILVAE